MFFWIHFWWNKWTDALFHGPYFLQSIPKTSHRFSFFDDTTISMWFLDLYISPLIICIRLLFEVFPVHTNTSSLSHGASYPCKLGQNNYHCDTQKTRSCSFESIFDEISELTPSFISHIFCSQYRKPPIDLRFLIIQPYQCDSGTYIYHHTTHLIFDWCEYHKWSHIDMMKAFP